MREGEWQGRALSPASLSRHPYGSPERKPSGIFVAVICLLGWGMLGGCGTIGPPIPPEEIGIAAKLEQEKLKERERARAMQEQPPSPEAEPEPEPEEDVPDDVMQPLMLPR